VFTDHVLVLSNATALPDGVGDCAINACLRWVVAKARVPILASAFARVAGRVLYVIRPFAQGAVEMDDVLALQHAPATMGGLAVPQEAAL